MRRSLSAALSAACLAGGLALGTAPAAHAAPAPAAAADVTNCQYGHNGSLWVSATCDATAGTDWYLRIHCVRGSGRGVWVNGTLVYGGPGTSWAQCASTFLEIDDTEIVTL